jgi:type I restriction enzyme S subunit
VAEARTEKLDPTKLGNLPFIGLEHIEAHTSRLLGQSTAKDVKSSVSSFRRGDILFGRLRPYLNKVIEAPFDGCASAEVVPFEPQEGIVPTLLKCLMMSADFLEYTASLDRGDRPRVKGEEICRYRIWLPPTAEQRRIVAKVDVLTARITRARADLDRVPVLAKWLRESAVENLLSPSPAPTGWNRHKLGVLIDDGPTNGWSPKSDPSAQGALTLKLTATTSGRFRLDEGAVKRIHETPSKNSKFWLRAGDLLVQRANALEYVGASAIFDGPSHTYIYPDLMMRLRFNNPSLTRLVWYRLNSPSTRRYFRDKATGTAGNMPKISGSVVREVTIELPQESYWKGLVAKLDAIFARADRLEAEAGHARRLLDRLESSILAKAFRGELVSQDPKDEPASVLLERIRLSRSVAPKPNRGRRAISTDA